MTERLRDRGERVRTLCIKLLNGSMYLCKQYMNVKYENIDMLYMIY